MSVSQIYETFGLYFVNFIYLAHHANSFLLFDRC